MPDLITAHISYKSTNFLAHYCKADSSQMLSHHVGQSCDTCYLHPSCCSRFIDFKQNTSSFNGRYLWIYDWCNRIWGPMHMSKIVHAGHAAINQVVSEINLLCSHVPLIYLTYWAAQSYGLVALVELVWWQCCLPYGCRENTSENVRICLFQSSGGKSSIIAPLAGCSDSLFLHWRREKE